MNDLTHISEQENNVSVLVDPKAKSGTQFSLLKISDKEFVEIIRPETNLEKWNSFIFPHPKAKGLDEERTFTFDTNLPDGRNVTSSITVNPANNRSGPTSRTYDVYLAIIALWDQRGLLDDPFFTSIREILKMMRVPLNGKWYDIVTKELETLFVSTITWKFSYTGETKFESHSFQKVLDTLDYVSYKDRADQSDKFNRVCKIRLAEPIRRNHKAGKTNPILWSERKALTSSVAKVLYSRLDTFLFTRSIYERTGLNLVTDLYLTLDRYKYPSQRLELLEKLKKQLDGRRLSGNRILKIETDQTADKQDYKLIARAISTKAITNRSNLPVVNKNKHLIANLIDEIDSVVGGKKENWKLYESFCKYYSETLIMRAIGEYKEGMRSMLNKSPLNRRKIFTVIVHRTAHSMGKEWIKECGPACKHRPANKLL